jgi:heme/copper-type cytochrome/quinol oxidase subunit 3
MLEPSRFDRRTPEHSREPSFKMSSAQLGMLILLASLSILFAASLVAHAVTRAESESWPDARAPGLLVGLSSVSVTLVAISAALHAALHAVRKNRFSSVVRALGLSLVLVGVFLLIQGHNWDLVARAQAGVQSTSLYLFTFYLLTVLHAVHVAAGIVPLAIVFSRARRKEYTSSRYDGLRFCAQYWDFLLAVWAVLVVVVSS